MESRTPRRNYDSFRMSSKQRRHRKNTTAQPADGYGTPRELTGSKEGQHNVYTAAATDAPYLHSTVASGAGHKDIYTGHGIIPSSRVYPIGTAYEGSTTIATTTATNATSLGGGVAGAYSYKPTEQSYVTPAGTALGTAASSSRPLSYMSLGQQHQRQQQTSSRTSPYQYSRKYSPEKTNVINHVKELFVWELSSTVVNYPKHVLDAGLCDKYARDYLTKTETELQEQQMQGILYKLVRDKISYPLKLSPAAQSLISNMVRWFCSFLTACPKECNMKGFRRIGNSSVYGAVSSLFFQNHDEILVGKSSYNVNDMMKEAYTGMYFMNVLRLDKPYWMYTYWLQKCSNPIITDSGFTLMTCQAASEGQATILVEYLNEGVSYNKFVFENNNELDQIMVLLRIIDAIGTMWELGITHGDLHWNNIIVTEMPEKVFVPFGTTTKSKLHDRGTLSEYVPTIIDFGFSSASIPAGIYQSHKGTHNNPYRDVEKFLYGAVSRIKRKSVKMTLLTEIIEELTAGISHSTGPELWGNRHFQVPWERLYTYLSSESELISSGIKFVKYAWVDGQSEIYKEAERYLLTKNSALGSNCEFMGVLKMLSGRKNKPLAPELQGEIKGLLQSYRYMPRLELLLFNNVEESRKIARDAVICYKTILRVIPVKILPGDNTMFDNIIILMNKFNEMLLHNATMITLLIKFRASLLNSRASMYVKDLVDNVLPIFGEIHATLYRIVGVAQGINYAKDKKDRSDLWTRANLESIFLSFKLYIDSIKAKTSTYMEMYIVEGSKKIDLKSEGHGETPTLGTTENVARAGTATRTGTRTGTGTGTGLVTIDE